jgi:iron complex transport system ATP-binding protein
MAEVISVSGLCFSYGLGFELRDISLTVERGNVTVLLGPNGCGKTTLLKCMNALLTPGEGKVQINGKDVFSMGRGELARLVGFVPQSHTPSFPYSVVDVVLMGRVSCMSIFQQPSSSDYAKAENALKVVGLSALKERPYTEISGGERQLALIARAIAQEPEALLLDEPTAHLDFKNQYMVLGMVKKVARERGIAVVMSLHDPNQAMQFSDCLVLINAGRIFSMGRPEDVVSPESIRELYGIDTDVIYHGGRKLIMPVH